MNKLERDILNQTRKRKIQILENKMKKFHKTLNASLKIFQHKDSKILND